jgi:hypothetical protein
MEKFKVKSLAVSGRGNKIFRTGDEVFEGQFPDGRAKQLVKQGHLISLGNVDGGIMLSPDPSEIQPQSVSDKTESDSDDVTRGTKESPDDGENESGDGASDGPEDDDKNADPEIGIAQIKRELKERGVKFEKNSTYADLYKIWANG